MSMRAFLAAAALGWLPVPLAAAAAKATPPAPENLAPKAKVSASSEYSASHAAGHVADGAIPLAESKRDAGRAWCTKAAHQAELTLEWPAAVTVAEVVYFGRTAWQWVENFKDYELYLDGAAEPAAKGRFKVGHGPQRIRLPKPARVRRITLKFLSSYGGSNPGASEVQVYSASPSDAALAEFMTPDVHVRKRYRAFVPKAKDSPELAADLAAGKLGFEKLVLVHRHPIDPSHVYTYHCEGQRDGGGLCLYDLRTRELTTLVDAGEGQVMSCDLSFDGRRVVFAMRRGPQQPYQVHTVNVDGTALRQLTSGKGPTGHNYDPCWLADGGIAFLSTRVPLFPYCFHTPVGVLFRMQADGSAPRRLSANMVNDFTPSVLSDGRIMFSRWEYVDRPAIPIQSLWTVNPDGTMLQVLFGNRSLSPATFFEAHEIPGTHKVICTMTAHNGPVRGGTGVIDRALGVDAQEAIVNLTPEVGIGRVDRGSGNSVRGPYESPFPIDDERYLVSCHGTVLVRDYAGEAQAAVIEPRDGMGFYSPRPLRPRPRPPIMPPRAFPASAEQDWATLYLQDVYNGLQPYVRRGEVKRICVVEEMSKPKDSAAAFGFQKPLCSCGATYAPKTVWGFADVEADGSAHFKVPANRAIYFLALDAAGRAVQRMRSFTMLAPGERQGCIGCHEPRNQAPPVRQFSAVTRPPGRLAPPGWGVRGFSYAHIVQPVLDRHCAKCHTGPAGKGGIDLSGDLTDYFNVSYEHLARCRRRGGRHEKWGDRYTSWIATNNGAEENIPMIAPKTWGSPRSQLADLVLSGHPDARGQARVSMTPADRQRILTWIDVNVPYYGTAEWRVGGSGGRHLYPRELKKVLGEVARRRCAECHKPDRRGRVRLPGGRPWVRITNPQHNDFLTAPLARSAGGTQACGKAVFKDAHDPDYQAILKTFQPVHEMIKKTPRMDMPAAEGACRAEL